MLASRACGLDVPNHQLHGSLVIEFVDLQGIGEWASLGFECKKKLSNFYLLEFEPRKSPYCADFVSP